MVVIAGIRTGVAEKSQRTGKALKSDVNLPFHIDLGNRAIKA